MIYVRVHRDSAGAYWSDVTIDSTPRQRGEVAVIVYESNREHAEETAYMNDTAIAAEAV